MTKQASESSSQARLPAIRFGRGRCGTARPVALRFGTGGARRTTTFASVPQEGREARGCMHHIHGTCPTAAGSVDVGLVNGVETILGGTVVAFMSANHIDPDVAVEVFVPAADAASHSDDGCGAARMP